MDELYEEAFAYFRMKRVLFRGFSIDKNKGVVSLQDIRSPYYRSVSSQDLNILLRMGFRQGATYLLMESDQRKIEKYTTLAEQKSEAAKKVTDPRKQEEYKNSIARYNEEISYYGSQVRRWQKLI